MKTHTAADIEQRCENILKIIVKEYTRLSQKEISVPINYQATTSEDEPANNLAKLE